LGSQTGFELVVLAWSSARRGISEAVVAGVVGSYAYNATMTLGAAALVKPLHIKDPVPLRLPMLAMLIALTAVLAMASRGRVLHRRHGWMLLAAYPLFLAVAPVASPA